MLRHRRNDGKQKAPSVRIIFALLFTQVAAIAHSSVALSCAVLLFKVLFFFKPVRFVGSRLLVSTTLILSFYLDRLILVGRQVVGKIWLFGAVKARGNREAVDVLLGFTRFGGCWLVFAEVLQVYILHSIR